jgi:hypothetical protein
MVMIAYIQYVCILTYTLVVEKEGLLVRHAGQDQQYHGAVCPTDLTQEVTHL